MLKKLLLFYFHLLILRQFNFADKYYSLMILLNWSFVAKFRRITFRAKKAANEVCVRKEFSDVYDLCACFLWSQSYTDTEAWNGTFFNQLQFLHSVARINFHSREVELHLHTKEFCFFAVSFCDVHTFLTVSKKGACIVCNCRLVYFWKDAQIIIYALNEKNCIVSKA